MIDRGRPQKGAFSEMLDLVLYATVLSAHTQNQHQPAGKWRGKMKRLAPPALLGDKQLRQGLHSALGFLTPMQPH